MWHLCMAFRTRSIRAMQRFLIGFIERSQGRFPRTRCRPSAKKLITRYLQAGGTPAQAQAAAGQVMAVAQQPGTSTGTLLLIGVAAVGAIILIKAL